jgi:hypothetical protein
MRVGLPASALHSFRFGDTLRLFSTSPSVNTSPSQNLLRQYGPAACAVVLGVWLGRELQSSLHPSTSQPVAVSQATPLAPSVTPTVPEIERPPENSDANVEAEVARLLGGASNGKETRSPAEVLDAITVANGEKSDLRRFLATYEAVGELGKDALAAALERAKAENNPIAIRALERRWAEVDPAGAAKALADGSVSALGEAFFSAWAKSNPASALQWYAGLEAGDLKNQTRASILDRVAKMDPQRALDYANQMPAGDDQKQLVNKALAAIGAKDPKDALAAAQRLPEGEGRNAGLNAILIQVANSNPAEAQKLLADLPAGSVSTAGGVIAAKLVQDNPQAGLDFAATLPDGPGRDSAFAGIARTWAGRDVEAAAKWLDALPKGSARDSAVASFASRTAPRDPEGATLWASTLPQGSQRSSVLAQTIAVWQRTNPTAATEWITNAPGLSPEERNALSQVQANRPDIQRFQQARRQRAGN